MVAEAFLTTTEILPECKLAINEHRSTNGIEEPMVNIDTRSVSWFKTEGKTVEEQSIEHSIGSERSFGIVFAVVFAIIGGYIYWTSGVVTWWPFFVASLFIVAAFVFPRLLRWPNHIWFKFGLLLGRIIAPLVMAVVYLLVMAPLGLLMRLLGKDLLRLKLDSQCDSYWIERETPPQPMKNQF